MIQKRAPLPVWLICLFCCGLQAVAWSQSAYGFLENRGQIRDQYGQPNPEVQYLLGLNNGLQVHLRADGFSYDAYARESATSPYRLHRVDVTFVGAQPGSCLTAQEKADDYLIYYDTPQGTIVHHFGRVILQEVYPGIDVEFISRPDSEKPFEYNFLLSPGARLSDIRMEYAGALGAFCSAGELRLQLTPGVLREDIPHSYLAGNQEAVAIHYTERVPFQQGIASEGAITVGFSGPEDQITEALVIDPVPHLAWGTYYGDSGEDQGRDMALDGKGNAYVIGTSQSLLNIATAKVHQTTLAGGFDAVVAKFNSLGVRQWGGYYGGIGDEFGQGIAVNEQGEVYIVGATSSATGIATPGAHQTVYNPGERDAFIAKLNATGTRQWGTYYGGTGEEFANGIALDRTGNAFITGWTNSNSQIATPGTHQPAAIADLDGFLARFSATGTLQWGTYLGGDELDIGLVLVIDSAGDVLTTGWTSSTTGIATPGAYQTTYGGSSADVYLMKFSGSDGTRQWGTYYGGPQEEYGDGIALDAANNIYLAGPVTSVSGIATPGTHQQTISGSRDAFVAKFTPAGFRTWGSYFGGTGEESGYGVFVDPGGSGAVFLSGYTTSTSGIATAEAHQVAYGGGNNDAFLAKLDANGVLVWGSYYGGEGEDRGYGIETDVDQNTYLVGWVGSNAGIASPNGHQQTFGGGGIDLLIAKFADCYEPPAPIDITPPTDLVLCSGNATVLRVRGEGELSWYDAPGGGTLLGRGDTLATRMLTATTTFYAQDSVCAPSATRTAIRVTVNSLPPVSGGQDRGVCQGEQVTLQGTGAVSYAWDNGITNGVAFTPTTTMTYTVTGTDSNGCQDSARVTIAVNTLPAVSGGSDRNICANESVILNGTGAVSYVWDNGLIDGVTFSVMGTTIFTVVGTDANGCQDTAQVTVTVNPLPLVIATSDNSLICAGETVTLRGTGASTYSWDNGVIDGITFSPTGTTTYTVTGTDANGCQATDELTVTVRPAPVITVGPEPLITVCSGESVALEASGGDTYAWTGPGGFTSLLPNPLVVNPSAGTYQVRVSVTGQCSAVGNVQVVLNPKPNAAISRSASVCSGAAVTLTASGGAAFLWNTGDTQARLVVTPAATTRYSVVVSNGTCRDTATLEVRVVRAPTVSLPRQLTAKPGEVVTLNAGSGAESYRWSPATGLSCTDCAAPELTATESRTYCVTAITGGCEVDACVAVEVNQDCPVYVPNAFSPNEDGINDELCAFSTCLQEVTLQIFNRWGGLVFSGQGIDACWDGRVSGAEAPAGVYLYKITGKNPNGRPAIIAGDFVLVR